jgi:predicted DNA-binding protein
MENKKRFTFNFPPKLRARLDAYCENTEKTLTSVIIDAVIEYLDKRQQF